MGKAYQHAIAMQKKAASPKKSVFVSANAGSGKTRVLVDRVSRILLEGTPPDKILCLTYTKAAANEMQARLFEALGKWSIMEGDALTSKLLDLTESAEPIAVESIGRARQLFARALETPGGLKVQTIHAFCEKLLRQFPLEAGILPGSESIDEHGMRTYFTKTIETLERAATARPDDQLAQALRTFVEAKSEQAFELFVTWAMSSCYRVDDWKKHGLHPLAQKLGVGVDERLADLKRAALEATPMAQLLAALEGLRASTAKTDQARADIIEAFVGSPQSIEKFDAYCGSFFTQKGTLKKRMVTKSAGPAAQIFFAHSENRFAPEIQRLLDFRERAKAIEVMTLTKAAFTLACFAVKTYRGLKKKHRVIDFDDQIMKARDLLGSSAAKDWVRYKLDGGVDHVLLDEAQDTAFAQWSIVDALTEEFFQPSPDSDPKKPRTLFAVGDEKQSIYSFQGARPELFLEKLHDLTKRQNDTPDVKMSMSFRSCAQILSVVDQVFYKDKAILETFDHGENVQASDLGKHTAYRTDPGLVEFWPAFQTEKTPDDTDPSWPAPVDAPGTQSAPERLAKAIAEQIAQWLATNTPVRVKDGDTTVFRAIRPGDIMILVKGRLQFFDAVIRNLKQAGVPVAGADRLELASSLVVQDLLSLGKFVLNPLDDLALAEVLTSPLVGWDDDRLFNAAYVGHRKNGTSLWAALEEGSEKRLLNHLISLSKHHAPFEFYARTLAYIPETKKDDDDCGESLKQRLLNRLGAEINDVVDVFLNRALEHQRRSAPNLLEFVRESILHTDKVKREMDTSLSEVRVMTVHAAKGLEAPIVILPDTTQLPNAGKDILFPCDDGFVMNVAETERPSYLKSVYDERLAKLYQEDLRLLYVALTRAESRLLICGFESRGKVAQGSWHDRIERALEGLGAEITCSDISPTVWRYGEALANLSVLPDCSQHEQLELPAWARTRVKNRAHDGAVLHPSHLQKPDDDPAEYFVPVRSPLTPLGESDKPFLRGALIHKLLEILPDIDPGHWRERAMYFLRSQDISPSVRDEICSTVLSVLNAPNFKNVFSTGSKSEVAIAGTIETPQGSISLSGQIDRLWVAKDHVLAVDYKSNRPAAKTLDDIPTLYVRQMAAYRALLAQIYPGRTIQTALLWTDGPKLMALPDSVLDTVRFEDFT